MTAQPQECSWRFKDLRMDGEGEGTVWESYSLHWGCGRFEIDIRTSRSQSSIFPLNAEYNTNLAQPQTTAGTLYSRFLSSISDQSHRRHHPKLHNDALRIPLYSRHSNLPTHSPRPHLRPRPPRHQQTVRLHLPSHLLHHPYCWRWLRNSCWKESEGYY